MNSQEIEKAKFIGYLIFLRTWFCFLFFYSVLLKYMSVLSPRLKCFNTPSLGDLQDGWGVRGGDHLPPHKYIKDTSTCWTTPTEHLLNTGRRTQTSRKARTPPPRTSVGQKKKEKTETKNRDGTCTSVRELWRRKSFHALGNPFTGGDGGWQGASFRATEENTATGVWRAKWRDSRTEDLCWPALTSLRDLSAHLPGRVAAGSWGLGFRGQTPGSGLGLVVWTQPEEG